jgi:hypothetical protein
MEDKIIKKPDFNDKRYTYYHKKLRKKMLNNELFAKDMIKWNSLQKVKE